MLFVRFAGILSAYGLALADVVHEAQEPCARVYDKGKLIMRKVINNNFSNDFFSFFRFSNILCFWSLKLLSHYRVAHI